jgi:hypothetical protein
MRKGTNSRASTRASRKSSPMKAFRKMPEPYFGYSRPLMGKSARLTADS